MKVSHFCIALFVTLAFVLSVYAIFKVQDINTKINAISSAQDSILDELNALDNTFYITKAKIGK